MAAADVLARRAPVRPRVVSPEGECLLEDLVRARLDACEWRSIELDGTSGSGKSTALQHLAHKFAGERRLILADNPDLREMERFCDLESTRLLVCASPCSFPASFLAAEHLRLAPWSDDDCIEYLLAVHPSACSSVMRRFRGDKSRRQLAGLPSLYRIVLDQMAASDSLADIGSSLRQEIYTRLSTPKLRSAVGLWCFSALCHPEQTSRLSELMARWEDADSRIRSLVGQAIVRDLLGADYLAHELRTSRDLQILELKYPRQLVAATSKLIKDDAFVQEKLGLALRRRKRERHAMATSLLHATKADWKPDDKVAPQLMHAYLPNARWHAIHLKGLSISNADLSDSDLSESQLRMVTAHMSRLQGARWHGARLINFSANHADMTGADFSHVRAPKAVLVGAKLERANFEGALLMGANLRNADLTGANFRRANLESAHLFGAALLDADFTGADLTQAVLNRLSLRLGVFAGAQFAQAAADSCDLEYMRLPGANFEDADLQKSLLTGSYMPDACLRRANLRGTGLADIEWEGADLYEADMRGCTFHLGSSRSGLVDSPIASEGSRTGFYTDEYYEQGFKAPEEIRRANLRNADLRCAVIDDVDFYLVDLRGAKYTPEQEDHFRRCRAILETRV